LKYIKDIHPEYRDEIITNKKINPELDSKLKQIMTQYSQAGN
jgi:hypothetical protein